ncbi:hypothetical protein MOK15_12940 [Sphingobium sp. BYY-5]|uniref:hypothetical protein n=1 Tax=Sphingobium sp. BYY-5 TaxID=2926400 RepID=UPI001FA6DF83|nr:hypothetical protein [Sphingobium sp. BYY-5]MCI4590994.1 hypothetical protein [Sphingobium sp. BYY-5]
MNPFEMVVAIVAIASIASVIRAKYGVVRRGRGEELIQRGPDPEAERLRAEVKALKDRVAVLERLATDGSNALEREFEKLRDRD